MRRAFTLIELLVVLAIVLILASLLVVGLAKLWPNVRSAEAQTALTNIASGVTKLKADHAVAHKPFAWYINTMGMANPAQPTLAELRARASIWNPAVELCAKRVLPELVLGVPGRWPGVNVRLRSRDLPPGDLRSYDFTTYYEPTQRQLSEITPGSTALIDPWGRPYQYLISNKPPMYCWRTMSPWLSDQSSSKFWPPPVPTANWMRRWPPSTPPADFPMLQQTLQTKTIFLLCWTAGRPNNRTVLPCFFVNIRSVDLNHGAKTGRATASTAISTGVIPKASPSN